MTAAVVICFTACDAERCPVVPETDLMPTVKQLFRSIRKPLGFGAL